MINENDDVDLLFIVISQDKMSFICRILIKLINKNSEKKKTFSILFAINICSLIKKKYL